MIEKLDGAELPPPGVGFESTRFVTCPAASAEAGTVACMLVALTYVVCSAAPFRVVAVEEIYPVPVKVSVCAGEPAGTPIGETDVIVALYYLQG